MFRADYHPRCERKYFEEKGAREPIFGGPNKQKLHVKHSKIIAIFFRNLKFSIILTHLGARWYMDIFGGKICGTATGGEQANGALVPRQRSSKVSIDMFAKNFETLWYCELALVQSWLPPSEVARESQETSRWRTRGSTSWTPSAPSWSQGTESRTDALGGLFREPNPRAPPRGHRELSQFYSKQAIDQHFDFSQDFSNISGNIWIIRCCKLNISHAISSIIESNMKFYQWNELVWFRTFGHQLHIAPRQKTIKILHILYCSKTKYY